MNQMHGIRVLNMHTQTQTHWRPSDKRNNSAVHYKRRQSLTVLTSHKQSQVSVTPKHGQHVFTERQYCYLWKFVPQSQQNKLS